MLPRKQGVFGLLVLSSFSAGSYAQIPKDSHRSACTAPDCREVRAFIKAHYCGASPFGNGPDDSCDLRQPESPSPGVVATADFNCEWDDKTGKSICKQTGTVPPEVQAELLNELHQVGLPKNDDRLVLFSVLSTASTGWLLAEANYERVENSELSLCQIIGVVDPKRQLHVLRRVHFQRTDAEVPTVTTWSPVDIASVNGRQEFILEGDAYENHWFEAIEMQDGVFKTVFSGLGYYL